MPKIINIISREILDSRGIPTLETTVFLDDNSSGTASVSAGSSIGGHELVELRDQDPHRYQGMGVLKAVEAVKKIIAPSLINQEVSYQNKIDQILLTLDKTPKKEKVGVNSLISVSVAVFKAAAAAYKLPVYAYFWAKYRFADKNLSFPSPCFNLVNGGTHGIGNLDFQEYHLIPSSRFSFAEGLQIGAEVYQSLKKILNEHKLVTSVGDDGGFTPNLFTNLDTFELIKEAALANNYRFDQEVFFSLDVAANQFYKDNLYFIKDRAQAFNREEFIQYYEALNGLYHLLLIEDPLFEDDWEGWQTLTNLLGQKTLIVGDDLICTNRERLQKAIDLKACNGIILKLNQISTLTELMEIVKICKENNLKIVVSHRGGETNDDFIADLAVGVGANFVKFGAPARGERLAKYHRLLKIEQEIRS